MRAKVTSKNQLALPKALGSRFPGSGHFEVQHEGERIFLTPKDVGRAVAVLAMLGVAAA